MELSFKKLCDKFFVTIGFQLSAKKLAGKREREKEAVVSGVGTLTHALSRKGGYCSVRTEGFSSEALATDAALIRVPQG